MSMIVWGVGMCGVCRVVVMLSIKSYFDVV